MEINHHLSASLKKDEKMHRIIIGGTGLIGLQLVDHWLIQGHTVTVIGRSTKKIREIFQNRVNALELKSLKPEIFREAELVVNLAGAGIAEKRWSKERKQEIIQSRINVTQKIVELLTSLGQEAPPLFNASAIGIYGLQEKVINGLPPKLDETTPIDWNLAPDFLSHIGREWEKMTRPAKEKGIRVVNLRFGVVLAKLGGALPKIIQPFYFYLGGEIGTGQQPFTWIAIDDVIRAIDFLLEKRDIAGPVNIVAPGCVTQEKLSKTIGKILHKPSFLPTPAFIMKLIFGEMAHELLLEGQHVYPSVLLDSGFVFSFPEIELALRHVLEGGS